MGLSSKQLKATLERYGYTVLHFFYTKKYYVFVECVFAEQNIPVLIQLEEMLKFNRSEELEDYRIKEVDIKDLLRTNFRYEHQKINVEEEDFEKELIKKYKKNTRVENMLEIQNNNLVQMYEQQNRLNTIINKSHFTISLIDDGHLATGRIYEIKNYPISQRKMYITFSLQHLYDNNVNIKKQISQIYLSVDETLSEHFDEQLRATEDLIKNYKVDYSKIGNVLKRHDQFDEEYQHIKQELDSLVSNKESIKSMLSKNKEKLSEIDYQRMRTTYEPKLEKLNNAIIALQNKSMDIQMKQKFIFLKVDQIIFDNLKYLQFIRKNLMELNNLFS